MSTGMLPILFYLPPFHTGTVLGDYCFKSRQTYLVRKKIVKFKIYHSNKLLDCYCSVDFFPSFFKLWWRACYPQNMQIYKEMFILFPLDINLLLWYHCCGNIFKSVGLLFLLQAAWFFLILVTMPPWSRAFATVEQRSLSSVIMM